MGVYMGYLKNTGINIGSRIGRFCSSRQDPKTEDRLVGSEELKPIVNEPMSVVRDHLALCPASTGPICHYAHLLPKGPETVRRKTLGHSICDIIGCGYLL